MRRLGPAESSHRGWQWLPSGVIAEIAIILQALLELAVLMLGGGSSVGGRLGGCTAGYTGILGHGD